MKNFKLAMAGNVFPVAYEIIKNKGYQVLRNGESYVAKMNDREFIADDTVQLLGLIMIYETKGDDWTTTDQVIEEFLKNLG